jgi:hypothetical protein
VNLPSDFNRDLWLDPLTFEGLVGAAIADGLYSELFRADGFAKPIGELRQDKRLARLIERVSQ